MVTTWGRVCFACQLGLYCVPEDVTEQQDPDLSRCTACGAEMAYKVRKFGDLTPRVVAGADHRVSCARRHGFIDRHGHLTKHALETLRSRDGRPVITG